MKPRFKCLQPWLDQCTPYGANQTQKYHFLKLHKIAPWKGLDPNLVLDGRLVCNLSISVEFVHKSFHGGSQNNFS